MQITPVLSLRSVIVFLSHISVWPVMSAVANVSVSQDYWFENVFILFFLVFVADYFTVRYTLGL